MNKPNPYLMQVGSGLFNMQLPGVAPMAPPTAPIQGPPPPPAAPLAPAGPPPPPIPWKGEDPLANIPTPPPIAQSDPATNVANAVEEGYQSAISPPSDAVPPPQAKKGAAPGMRLDPVRGGYAPAHEVDLRGPSLKAAMGRANAVAEGAIDSVDQRTQSAAVAEYATALDLQRKAQAREDAEMRAAAERAEELAQRQAEFDSSVKALSKASIDPERFWASRSTGQKIGAMIGIILGGYVQGVRGGSNVGLDVLNQQIDRDIKAQEFAFNTMRDTAHAKQTAFSLAMQKFGNVDAARSLARASALDSVQAQLMQHAALWKGTEAANRADVAIAQLEQNKMQQVAQGIRFMPAAVGPTKYVDPETGFTYTEAEAKQIAAKVRDQQFEIEKIAANTAGDIVKDRSKAEVKAAADMTGRTVPSMEVGGLTLPSYAAATETEAKEDREARKAGAELVDMIDQILRRRKEQGYIGRVGSAMSPVSMKWENEVTGLGPQLGVKFGKVNKLGTYDKGVENLIHEIQGNLRATGAAPDEKLEVLRSQVIKGLAKDEQVQTGQGVPQAKTLKLYGGAK